MKNSHTTHPNTHRSTSFTSGPCNGIDKLFLKLGLIYQHRFTHQFQGRSWTTALKAHWQTLLNKMTPENIQMAVDYLESSDNNRYVDFPPSALQFLQLPDHIKQKNLPPAAVCYEAAIAGQWDLHPIVKPIAKACGIYWLRTQATDREGRARFAEHYREVVRRFLDHQPLDLRPALPAPRRADTHNAQTAKKRQLTAFQTLHQRADRMIATQGVMEKIRAAKTAKEKRAICRALWHQYKTEEEAVGKIASCKRLSLGVSRP